MGVAAAAVPAATAASTAATAASTAATVATITTIIATMYSIYAQQEASSFQAAQAKRNAEAEEKMGADARARGLEEGTRIALAGGATRGAIRAAYGASGVELTSGSPLDVLSDAAMFAKLDKEVTQSNAEREAFANKRRAGDYLAQSSLDRMRANQGIGATILSGATQAYGDYYAVQRPR